MKTKLKMALITAIAIVSVAGCSQRTATPPTPVNPVTPIVSEKTQTSQEVSTTAKLEIATPPPATTDTVATSIATQEAQAKNTNTYKSDKYKFTLEYPADWQVMDKEKEGMGIIITANDQKDEWGGTSLNLNFTWEVGDPGMGLKDTKNTEITNPDGIKFGLSFNAYDEEFYTKEVGEPVPDKEEVFVFIDTDAIPGLKIYSYNTRINPDGENQLMEILNSVKKIQ